MLAVLAIACFLLNIPTCDALTMFGMPSITVPQIAPVPLSTFNGVQTPTYMWKQQVYNEKRDVWGKNYTLIPSPDAYGCVAMNPAVYTNAIVTGIAGGNAHCTFTTMVNLAGAGGAAAVLILGPVPQLIAMFPMGAMPPAGMPPAVTWENLNTNDAVSKQIPLNLIAFAAVGSGVANVTLQLDYPSQNPLFFSYNNVASAVGFVYWFGITLSLVAVTFSAAKLYAFYTHEYIFSIGGACLGFCWFGCIWLLLNAFQGGNAGFAPGGIMTLDCNAFWELWVWTCSASALILIGFYFQEVASLTQQQSIPGLDRFKIPGMISIGLLWAANIILSSLSAGFKTNDVPPPTSGSYGVAVSVIYGVVGGAVLLIVVIGSIVLLKSMSDNLWRVILPVVILALFSTGMFAWCLGLWIQLRYFFETIPYNQQNLTILTIVTFIWGNAIIFASLSAMFSVRTSKEIEVSKSATSSTASSSKSGSSYGSSSATADPVVEL